MIRTGPILHQGETTMFLDVMPHALAKQKKEIDQLRTGLLEIRRRLVEMPGVTCGMSDVIDHALGSHFERSDGSQKDG